MYPRLEINLTKIQHNAYVIVDMCAKLGIEITGVTKVALGIPAVARALVAGGVTSLGDSRLANIMRMHEAGIHQTMWLLRSPALSEVEAVVEHVDVSLNSEFTVLLALSRAATRQRKEHQVILMADLGDLREGVRPKELARLWLQAGALPGIKLLGFGTNFACGNGVLPASDNMTQFVRLKKDLAVRAPLLSAGNSSALHLMRQGYWQGAWVSQVNHLRIGESIFLGWDIIDQTPLDGCYTDACMLQAEVIEVQEKTSIERGRHRRGLLALGKQDLGAGRLEPVCQKIEILGSSSDHMILDLGQEDITVGDVCQFRVDYGALLGLFTSPYVKKTFSGQDNLLPNRGLYDIIV